MSFSLTNAGSVLHRLADLTEEVMDKKPIINTYLTPMMVLNALIINKDLDKSLICGINKVKLEKQENVYIARIFRSFDILVNITPSFPEKWIKSVELQIFQDGHYGKHNKSFTTSDGPFNNLFFEKPIVHSMYTEIRVMITIDDRISENFDKQYHGETLATFDIFGIQLEQNIRKNIMERAERIILGAL